VASISSDAKLTKTSSIDGTDGGAHLAKLSVGDKSTERVVVFNTSKLKDLVKIDFGQIDQWFEEDGGFL
jgi:hypothetical protein